MTHWSIIVELHHTMATWGSPDIYAHALGPAALRLGHIYQTNSSWSSYTVTTTFKKNVFACYHLIKILLLICNVLAVGIDHHKRTS